MTLQYLYTHIYIHAHALPVNENIPMIRFAPQFRDRNRDTALTRRGVGIISEMITHTTAPSPIHKQSKSSM